MPYIERFIACIKHPKHEPEKEATSSYYWNISSLFSFHCCGGGRHHKQKTRNRSNQIDLDSQLLLSQCIETALLAPLPNVHSSSYYHPNQWPVIHASSYQSRRSIDNRHKLSLSPLSTRGVYLTSIPEVDSQSDYRITILPHNDTMY